MFSFCEDINSQNKFCEIKKNVKLSNGIVHDLYAYGFLFVARSQASHRSMITHTYYPHFNNVALAYIVV